MRLAILDSGHGFASKALFSLIRLLSRQPVPEPVKLMAYRGDFFGDPMKKVTHEAMRGPSAWSIGDRELMAAYVSKLAECQYCIKAHCAVSSRAYGDGAKVQAALADPASAPIDDGLRATLAMLRKLTLDGAVDSSDMRELLAAGVSRAQIQDALAVAFAFYVTTRLANAFDFAIPGPSAFEAGAKYLLARGYK
jgi:uncharacterized peroxidase-related enzyme